MCRWTMQRNKSKVLLRDSREDFSRMCKHMNMVHGMVGIGESRSKSKCFGRKTKGFNTIKVWICVGVGVA